MSQIEREQGLSEVVGRYRIAEGKTDAVSVCRMADVLFREAIQDRLEGSVKLPDGKTEMDDALLVPLSTFQKVLGELVGISVAETPSIDGRSKSTGRGRPTFVHQVWTALGLGRDGVTFRQDARLLFFLTLHTLIEATLRTVTEDELAHAADPALVGQTPSSSEEGDEATADAEETPGFSEPEPISPSGAEAESTLEDLAFEEYALNSQQQVYHAIWEALAVELALRSEPDLELANREAKVLRDSSRPYRGRRLAEQIRETYQVASGISYQEGMQFAGTLAGIVIQSSEEQWFRVARIGKTGTNKILPTHALLSRVKALSEQTLTLHHHAPLIEPPRDWGPQGIRQGGFHWLPLPFYKFHWKNEPIRQFLAKVDNPSWFAEVFSATNALQCTAWQVNLRVWEVVHRLYDISKVPVPELADEALFSPSAWRMGERAHGDVADLDQLCRERRQASIERRRRDLADLTPEERDAWRQWVDERFYSRKGGHLTGPGARAATRVALSTLIDALGRCFYFAYQADSRGRLYPVTGIFNPQGDDLNRALLEFANSKPLTAAGVRPLAVHGSQQISGDKILAYFGIGDRAQPTLDERVQWVEDHSDKILASARTPLKELWWRDVSKNPFMFLAFCFAWLDYKDKGEQVGCALPVHVDGTCNGLQHIAAVTRDEQLAAATSVLPGPIPRDIYSEVAATVRTRMFQLPNTVAKAKKSAAKPMKRGGDSMPPSAQDHEHAIEFLKRNPHLVDRAMAKDVVMIIPYGAGLNKYQEAIGRKLVNRSLEDWPARAQEPNSTDSERWVKDLPGIEQWKPRTRRPFSDPARERRATVARWLSEVCAFHLAQHFSDALDMMFPAIKRFKKRLSRAVEPVLRRKLPVMWVSPSGFPVLQDAFRLAENAIDVKVLKNRLRFSLRELQDQISEQGQRTGILPNFIHSLDAAHLVKTVNLARCKGVTDINTIHDSYATHACDMDILSQCIRDAFCEVYPSNENRLEQFERWCVALAGSTHDDGSSDSVGVVRTDAERALIGLARRWAPVDSEPVPPKGTVAKDKAPDLTEDWIDQVRQSEYFFT